MARRPDPDMLPKEERDTFTIQLNRVGDAEFRQWLDDELYLGKKAGRIPKDWDLSVMVKAMLRGEFKPGAPAPRPPGVVEPPTAKRPRSRK